MKVARLSAFTPKVEDEWNLGLLNAHRRSRWLEKFQWTHRESNARLHVLCCNASTSPPQTLYTKYYIHKDAVVWQYKLQCRSHLPDSRDHNNHVSRRILTPQSLWLQKHTDSRAHDFAHFADLWQWPKLANVTGLWSWRLCGTDPALNRNDNGYRVSFPWAKRPPHGVHLAPRLRK